MTEAGTLEATTYEAVGVTTRRRKVARGLVRDRTALLGLVLVVGMVLAVVAGPWFVEHELYANDVTRRFEGPSADYLLGTDHLGRDVFARLLYGGRLSIGATVVTALIIACIGTALGLLAGYAGGLIDTVVSRVIDALLAFPGFLLALALVGIFGPSLRNVVVAIVFVGWAGYARIVRASVLVEREQPYVEAAGAIGASPLRVIGRHLLPNIAGPIMVLTTLDMGGILLSLSALSFLGLGVQPPAPEWGAMLSDARVYLALSPTLMVMPGTAIFLMVLGFNLLGDGSATLWTLVPAGWCIADARGARRIRQSRQPAARGPPTARRTGPPPSCRAHPRVPRARP